MRDPLFQFTDLLGVNSILELTRWNEIDILPLFMSNFTEKWNVIWAHFPVEKKYIQIKIIWPVKLANK